MTTPSSIPFPERPLTVHPPVSAVRSMLGLVLGIVIGIGIWVLVAMWLGPSLSTDFALRSSGQPAASGRIEDGRCRSKLFLVTCDVTITARPDGMTRVENRAHYLFLDVHSGDYSSGVLYDPGNPELLSTELGMRMLWNRVICALALLLLGVASVFAGVKQWFSNAALRRRIHDQFAHKRMRPVPARLLEAGGVKWVVADPAGQAHAWAVPAKSRPFFLDGEHVLAVTPAEPPPGQVPMLFPLDEKLRWVDLTPEERAALQA
ncbi:hypothetical protein [Pseudoroseomonas cervicalis]|uniref:hypothetical protein n=1 Tax=Teichococcus cervicalis TaxID=204525 RepID=UPI002788EC66|nr:hypothetical protein [Pseudoroseomonas cervicalis]MDQ1080722.1 hypothetical protein [Pseudoroseomonas cervicalis]